MRCKPKQGSELAVMGRVGCIAVQVNNLNSYGLHSSRSSKRKYSFFKRKTRICKDSTFFETMQESWVDIPFSVGGPQGS